jgi:P27 family predicted phage terminase small subunit
VRGRKPTPIPLRELRNNPGRRPIPEGVDVGAFSDLPPAPDFLDEIGRAEWERVGRELLVVGLLTPLDAPALAAYCHAFSRWRRAEEKVSQTGEIVRTPNGMLVQSPYMQIANRALDQWTKMLAEFGMTPSSRTRVKASKRQAANPLEKYLGRRRAAT